MLMSRQSDRLDDIDIRLLRLLHSDGRASNSSLAEAVSLSESACFQRVRRLEKLRYIVRYSAIFNVARLSPGAMTVFTTVKLSSDQLHVVRGFENYLREIPEIIEWHGIVGEHDYLVRFLVPHFDRYRSILDDMMQRPLQVVSFTSLVAHRGDTKQINVESLLSATPTRGPLK